jgi:hypothetical protein
MPGLGCSVAGLHGDAVRFLLRIAASKAGGANHPNCINWSRDHTVDGK